MCYIMIRMEKRVSYSIISNRSGFTIYDKELESK
mgnify:FL=1